MKNAAAATTREIMAPVLARDLVDGEWVEVGANLPVPRAGVLLASSAAISGAPSGIGLSCHFHQ